MAGAFSSAFSNAYDIGTIVPPVPQPSGGSGGLGYQHRPKPTWASRIYDLIEILTSPHERFAKRFDAGVKLMDMDARPIISRKEVSSLMAELWNEWPEKFDELWSKQKVN